MAKTHTPPVAASPQGLSQAEAAARLALEGPNDLPGGGRRPALAIVAGVLREPMLLLLLAGGAILGLAFELLWLALTGLIIGALGRLVLPGRQEIGLLQTALIGIAASLLGGVLGEIFDAGWLIRFLVAVALAAIGVTLVAPRGRAHAS